MYVPRLASVSLLPKIAQVIDTLHPTNPVFWKTVRGLGTACGNLKILPQSYILPGFLEAGEWPIASRGPCDVYEGFYNGLKVCVKRVRIYSSGESEVAKTVCCRRTMFNCSFLTKHVGLLPRGRSVETSGASKHRPLPWCHSYSPSISFRLDGGWRTIGIHRKKPVCTPAQPRRFPPCYVEWRTYPLARFMTLLAAFTTSIPTVSYMGISRGFVGSETFLKGPNRVLA